MCLCEQVSHVLAYIAAITCLVMAALAQLQHCHVLTRLNAHCN